jgi:hypothetical protein
MKPSFIALVSLCLAAVPAFAQESPPPAPSAATVPCWEVLAPQPGTAPAAALKLNKCTGETWLLVRTRLSQANAPDIDSTYTFRWQRLMQDDAGEAVLASRAGPP